jgi:hypothetical protein
VHHSWKIECRTAGLRVDEQIEQVLGRIAPVAERVRDLAETDEVATRLQIVRLFDDDDGEEELFEGGIDEDGGLYERLAGQHQLLGWRLTSDQLSLLVSVRASIDSDEYN